MELPKDPNSSCNTSPDTRKEQLSKFMGLHQQFKYIIDRVRHFWHEFIKSPTVVNSGGGTPVLGYIRDVRPEWVSSPGRKPADECKFLTKNLQMGHNFDIILPGHGWFSSKLNKTYCGLVNFYCK